jgi:hypothetical protein
VAIIFAQFLCIELYFGMTVILLWF